MERSASRKTTLLLGSEQESVGTPQFYWVSIVWQFGQAVTKQPWTAQPNRAPDAKLSGPLGFLA